MRAKSPQASAALNGNRVRSPKRPTQRCQSVLLHDLADSGNPLSAPPRTAGPIKWNPETSTISAAGACPYVTPPTVGGNDNAARETKIFFGGKNKKWCKAIKDTGKPAATPPELPRALKWSDYPSADNWVCSDAAKCGSSDDVKTLAGLLPKTKIGEKEYEHQCVKYAAKTGAKQKHSDPEVATPFCRAVLLCPRPLLS